MSRRRGRIRLPTAITCLLTGLTAVAIILTTAVLVHSARDIIYQARQDALLADYRSATEAVRREIAADPSGAGWASVSSVLPARSAIVSIPQGIVHGSLTEQEVPAAWLVPAGQPPVGALRYLRTSLGGHEVFFVGLLWADTEPGAPTVLLVTAYSLEAQRLQVIQLVMAALAIGGVALVGTGIAGFLLARTLTRPLRRMTEMARALGEGGAPEFSPSAFADINQVSTALHDSSQRLARSMAELARSEQDARRLVSDVAHELRTPLTSMTAVAEILEDFDQATDEERRIAMDVSARGTRRLTVLREQLLELSRIDAGAAAVAPAEVELGALVAEAVHLSDPGGIAEVDVSAEQPVITDADRVRTIVANLVGNALRHGAPPIQVGALVSGGELVVTVHDHGPGVPAGREADIFERFVTLDAARHHPDSNGLGLAIARDNARLLGGELNLVPSEAGATFRLSIPLM